MIKMNITNGSNLSGLDIREVLGAIPFPMTHAITIVAFILGLIPLLGLGCAILDSFSFAFGRLRHFALGSIPFELPLALRIDVQNILCRALLNKSHISFGLHKHFVQLIEISPHILHVIVYPKLNILFDVAKGM